VSSFDQSEYRDEARLVGHHGIAILNRYNLGDSAGPGFPPKAITHRCRDCDQCHFLFDLDDFTVRVYRHISGEVVCDRGNVVFQLTAFNFAGIALFAELKQRIKLRLKLRRVRLRRLWDVAEQFHLAATAQNLKRLVRQQIFLPVSLQTLAPAPPLVIILMQRFIGSTFRPREFEGE
jgi:hypothetical protein